MFVYILFSVFEVHLPGFIVLCPACLRMGLSSHLYYVAPMQLVTYVTGRGRRDKISLSLVRSGRTRSYVLNLKDLSSSRTSLL
jgi:hypothetical protein